MAESDTDEKTLDASAQRLRQAREDGDVAVSREGSVAGVYLAALLATALAAGPALSEIQNLLVPLLDQSLPTAAATPAKQRIVIGPVASQVAIKQRGTNGGGRPRRASGAGAGVGARFRPADRGSLSALYPAKCSGGFQ